GLVPMDMISIKDLVMRGEASPDDVLNPAIERDPAVARRLWRLHQIEPGDGFVIASNSGGNGAIVEMAALAREANLPVIAVTSMEHTLGVASNHPSGKRLYELADVVIDNGAPRGDSLLDMPRNGRVCAVSSVTAAVIAQMIVADAVGMLLERGVDVPILISVNIPGGEDHNRRLQARYAGRIMKS